MPPPDDAALVSAVLAGDREAGDELVRRHGETLRALVRRRLRGAVGFGPQDVENIFQQAWLKLLDDGARCLRSYDPARPLAPFLVGVTLNACRDFLKRERPRRARPDPLASWTAVVEAPGERLEAAEARESLARALERLSPRDRTLLEWVEMQSLPPRMVAVLLGVAERSVGALASRARQRLRKLLKNEESLL